MGVDRAVCHGGEDGEVRYEIRADRLLTCDSNPSTSFL